jgi:hypothetical protein
MTTQPISRIKDVANFAERELIMSDKQKRNDTSGAEKDRKAKEQTTILKPSVQQDENDILDNVPGKDPSQRGHDVEQDREQTHDQGEELRSA